MIRCTWSATWNARGTSSSRFWQINMAMWCIWESVTAPSSASHQKVLEESPLRCHFPGAAQEMGETAIRATKAVGYENAGTIEFC